MTQPHGGSGSVSFRALHISFSKHPLIEYEFELWSKHIYSGYLIQTVYVEPYLCLTFIAALRLLYIMQTNLSLAWCKSKGIVVMDENDKKVCT